LNTVEFDAFPLFMFKRQSVNKHQVLTSSE